MWHESQRHEMPITRCFPPLSVPTIDMLSRAYKRVAPKKVLKRATAANTNGVMLASDLIMLEAAPEAAALAAAPPVLEEPECVAVAVTVPLPGVAVPELAPPAFWLPSPVRPGPFPAPWLMYFTAPDGIAGRFSPENGEMSQSALSAGQAAGWLVVEKSPLPLGAGFALSWFSRSVKPVVVVTELPLMVTRP